jgi:hypothetical protein
VPFNNIFKDILRRFNNLSGVEINVNVVIIIIIKIIRYDLFVNIYYDVSFGI